MSERTPLAPWVNIVGSTLGIVDPLDATEVARVEGGQLLTGGYEWLLSDTFVGNVVDGSAGFDAITRWILQQAISGTVTQASYRGVFQTIATNGSKASVDSQQHFAPLASVPVVGRFTVRCVDAPAANNRREWGFRDDAETTKIYFRVSTAGLEARVDNAGANVFVKGITTPIAGDNGGGYATFTIVWGKVGVEFYITAKVGTSIVTEKVAEYTLLGGATGYLASVPWRAYVLNTSVGPSTARTLHVAAIDVGLLGNVASRTSSRTVRVVSIGADTVLVYGPGILESCEVAAVGTQVWNLLEGTAVDVSNRIYRASTGIVANTYFLNSSWYFAQGLLFDHVSGSGADLFLRVRA